MFCKYCGHQISDDTLFCDNCGRCLAEREDGTTTKKSLDESVPGRHRRVEWIYHKLFVVALLTPLLTALVIAGYYAYHHPLISSENDNSYAVIASSDYQNQTPQYSLYEDQLPEYTYIVPKKTVVNIQKLGVLCYVVYDMVDKSSGVCTIKITNNVSKRIYCPTFKSGFIGDDDTVTVTKALQDNNNMPYYLNAGEQIIYKFDFQISADTLATHQQAYLKLVYADVGPAMIRIKIPV